MAKTTPNECISLLSRAIAVPETGIIDINRRGDQAILLL
jgi:hypothetical protein